MSARLVLGRVLVDSHQMVVRTHLDFLVVCYIILLHGIILEPSRSHDRRRDALVRDTCNLQLGIYNQIGIN